ncbi:ubiquitin-conjugating enzyme/RWD-like protein [Suillus paluster]|uniref:ubiquitin-conjugating enzyme/RWD-like protein n=1 Tax=Suillus paluster TaxID=48578 RepID=UPI001B87762F|nr:ubiquitin-conjugating enzyme/RWD-like protein [Suillus paluster]KAG1740185.1 ubiquitin-conjugating enzyme/RWD-like protein [Suillus paluster]
MSVTPLTMRRLMREITELKNNPPEGIRVVTSEENMLELTGIVEGPEQTPYAGGYFRVRFQFTHEFPTAPPKCWFATKIFHPNVSSAGEICVNTLKKDWQSSYGIGHILVTIKCLLIYPNPESALDEEAGKLLLEDYDAYCSRAKLITSVHATPRIPPPEFQTTSTEKEGESSTTPIPASIPTPAVVPPPTIMLPVPTSASSPRKSTSPTPPSQPLQSSPENTLPSSISTSTVSSKDGKERLAPLGTANSNVAGPAATATTKAVKRSAVSAGSGIEKRKKALKRL